MINFVNVSIPITNYKDYEYIDNKIIYRFNSKVNNDVVEAIECIIDKDKFDKDKILKDYKSLQKLFYNILLNRAKLYKLKSIIDYDSSDKVNTLSINNINGWLDKLQRAGLYNLLNTDTNIITLWLGNTSLDIDKTILKDILDLLEQYAYECYNVTALHKREINDLTNIEDVELYDITKSYPEPLKINI